MIGPDASEEEAPMAHDDETERDTVPLPDTSEDDRPPIDEHPEHSEAVQLSPSAAPGRSKGLIAAAVAGVLVVGGAVAATVGGGAGKGPGKAAAPTAGLAGRQISSTGDGASSSGSPWVWQTGQATGKSPGPTTGIPSTPGAPKPTGASSAPGTQPSSPGMGQRSSSAPGAPSSSVPSSSAGGPVPPSSSAPPPATVTLVAGPGCPNPAGGVYDAVGSGSGSGWGGNGSGGWKGDGCNGSMQSMPMTGDASNSGNHALWAFGSGTAGFSSCVVSVYVPWDGKATDTGGTAAEYQLSEGADAVVASFTVNQNSNHGRWVGLGTVGVGAGNLKLRLLDHGVDYPAGWRYGISAARLQCTA